MRLLDTDSLAALLRLLRQRGFETVGPSVRDGAIVYGPLDSPDDLPAGWTDEQSPGRYRLVRRDDDALFGHLPGAQAWKRFLYPPAERLWSARRGPGGMSIEREGTDTPRYAFIGVRPCELSAIAIQDRVFLEGPYADPPYRRRREGLFVVVVQCTEPGGTCFCSSMGTGPSAASGYDLALTEIVTEEDHFFGCAAGSEEGAALLAELPAREATPEERSAVERAIREAPGKMGRALETEGLKQALQDNPEHPRWDEIASRCLVCGNCTLVCPTCFCSDVRDTTALDGGRAERWRQWDSCFSGEFSYIHGGRVRHSSRSRYRQWLTHKLAGWIDQFGSSGCVGCGRCITWCPVGIDITEEARGLREVAVPGGSEGRASAEE